MRPTSSLGLATHSTSLLPRLPEEIPKITQATQHLTKKNCDSDIDKLGLQNDSKTEQNSLRKDWLTSDWLPDSKIIRKTKSSSLALPAVEGMSFLIRGLDCLK